MSIGSITGSGSTSSPVDASRVWRAGAVAASQAVGNQLDPRGFAQVEEQASAQRRQQSAEVRSGRQRQAPDGDRQRNDARQSASGPFTAFLAQSLAQSQDTAGSSSPTAANRSTALAAASYSEAAGLAPPLSGASGQPEHDVLPPPSSAEAGRGIDLLA